MTRFSTSNCSSTIWCPWPLTHRDRNRCSPGGRGRVERLQRPVAPKLAAALRRQDPALDAEGRVAPAMSPPGHQYGYCRGWYGLGMAFDVFYLRPGFVFFWGERAFIVGSVLRIWIYMFRSINPFLRFYGAAPSGCNGTGAATSYTTQLPTKRLATPPAATLAVLDASQESTSSCKPNPAVPALKGNPRTCPCRPRRPPVPKPRRPAQRPPARRSRKPHERQERH